MKGFWSKPNNSGEWYNQDTIIEKPWEQPGLAELGRTQPSMPYIDENKWNIKKIDVFKWFERLIVYKEKDLKVKSSTWTLKLLKVKKKVMSTWL